MNCIKCGKELQCHIDAYTLQLCIKCFNEKTTSKQDKDNSDLGLKKKVLTKEDIFGCLLRFNEEAYETALRRTYRLNPNYNPLIDPPSKRVVERKGDPNRRIAVTGKLRPESRYVAKKWDWALEIMELFPDYFEYLKGMRLMKDNVPYTVGLINYDFFDMEQEIGYGAALEVMCLSKLEVEESDEQVWLEAMICV